MINQESVNQLLRPHMLFLQDVYDALYDNNLRRELAIHGTWTQRSYRPNVWVCDISETRLPVLYNPEQLTMDRDDYRACRKWGNMVVDRYSIRMALQTLQLDNSQVTVFPEILNPVHYGWKGQSLELRYQILDAWSSPTYPWEIISRFEKYVSMVNRYILGPRRAFPRWSHQQK